MAKYPKWIEDKLQSMGNRDVALIYFLLDSQGTILDCGGQFEALCIQRPKPNGDIREVLVFMEGLLPLEQPSLDLPFIKMEPSVSVDAHLFRIKNGYALIVRDAAQKEHHQKIIQQKHNEHLLHHRAKRKKLNKTFDTGVQSMNEIILSEVFSALNLAVMEMTDDGALVFFGQPPQWIKETCQELWACQGRDMLRDSFSFLGNFIEDAQSFWEKGRIGSIQSGIWIENDDDGKELLFEATAVNASGKKLLIISQDMCDIQERQTVIQKGRELALNYQNLERSDRELKTAHDELEKRVRERTLELEHANHKLAAELEERKRIEEERTEALRQLKQAQKMEAIGTLAGGIAHDFNNILSAVMGFSELAMGEVDHGSGLEHKIGQILRAAERAKDLVRHILMFSHQADYEKKPLQLKLIVMEALKLLRASLPATIKIEKQINSNAYILADSTQMHQVMMNLCTNAGHAMKENGGTLSVRLQEQDMDTKDVMAYPDLCPGPHIVLTVQDSGQGISPDIIEKIFDPYFTTKEKDKGTGLGLSVVHGIVKKNNGAITVASTPGNGAIFQIFFPILTAPPVSQYVEPEIPFGHGEKILFIDDELFQTEMGSQMLKRLGYNVVTSNDSIHALNLFSQDTYGFDLVITDMTMPIMTGMVLAGKIMELRPGMPIILCSGYSDTIRQEDVVALGIKEYLMKPIRMKDLAFALKKVLT